MISIVQSGTVFGIMLGFTLNTIIGKTHWAICFLIEAGLLTTLGIIFFFLPQIYFSNNYIVIDGNDNELKQMEGNNGNSNQNVFAKLWINIGLIFTEYVFLFTCLSNCVIFFGITVISYWSPNYIENVLHEKRDYIILGVYSNRSDCSSYWICSRCISRYKDRWICFQICHYNMCNILWNFSSFCNGCCS